MCKMDGDLLLVEDVPLCLLPICQEVGLHHQRRAGKDTSKSLPGRSSAGHHPSLDCMNKHP